jgi:large subunit ribosomal protein L25
MERVTLNVQTREKSGKGTARTLRRQGNLPAVMYKGGNSTSIQLDSKELLQHLRAPRGEQTLWNLTFPDKTSKLAIIKKYQLHPISGAIIHADFLEIALTEKVRLHVSVNLVGEPIGVKRDKGILQRILRHVEIECLPDKIPGHIDLDVKDLQSGHSLHVSDIVAPEGVRIVTDTGEVVATVMSAAALEAQAAAAVAVEGAAAEAAAGAPEAAKAEKPEGEEPEKKTEKKPEKKEG